VRLGLDVPLGMIWLGVCTQIWLSLCATPAALAPAFARSALPRERVRSMTLADIGPVEIPQRSKPLT
jgi:hypothetical protein